MAARKTKTKAKKVSSPVKKTSKPAHKELFDNHPNLKILLFLFLAVAITFFILSSNAQR